jgi:hypothetical protein
MIYKLTVARAEPAFKSRNQLSDSTHNNRPRDIFKTSIKSRLSKAGRSDYNCQPKLPNKQIQFVKRIGREPVTRSFNLKFQSPSINNSRVACLELSLAIRAKRMIAVFNQQILMVTTGREHD